MNWSVRGTGAQAFTAATPADLLREMAEFVDEWTENDTSSGRFVADVSIRFGGESVTPWEGVVYTDNTDHVAALFEELRRADSTDVGQETPLAAAYAGAAELGYDEFEDLYEATGQVVNIGHVNVYLGSE